MIYCDALRYGSVMAITVASQHYCSGGTFAEVRVRVRVSLVLRWIFDPVTDEDLKLVPARCTAAAHCSSEENGLNTEN